MHKARRWGGQGGQRQVSGGFGEAGGQPAHAWELWVLGSQVYLSGLEGLRDTLGVAVVGLDQLPQRMAAGELVEGLGRPKATRAAAGARQVAALRWKRGGTRVAVGAGQADSPSKHIRS